MLSICVFYVFGLPFRYTVVVRHQRKRQQGVAAAAAQKPREASAPHCGMMYPESSEVMRRGNASKGARSMCNSVFASLFLLRILFEAAKTLWRPAPKEKSKQKIET